MADAGEVEKLEPVRREDSLDEVPGLGAEEEGDLPLVRLAALLELVDEGASAVVVTLRNPPARLLVEAVDEVVDLAEASFARLPTLTRLGKPAFHGVYDLRGELLPALDLPGLLHGGAGD